MGEGRFCRAFVVAAWTEGGAEGTAHHLQNPLKNPAQYDHGDSGKPRLLV